MANTSNSWTPAALVLLAARSTTPAAWLINTGRTEGGPVTIASFTPSSRKPAPLPARTPIANLTAPARKAVMVGRNASTAPLPVVTTTVMPATAAKLGANPSKPLTVYTIAMPTSDQPVPSPVRTSIATVTSTGALPMSTSLLPPAPKVTDTTSVPGWVPTILASLQAIARELANSQFTEWVSDSRPIVALAMSESNGKYDAVAEEGFSTKLGRQYCSFGLFQINELWAQSYHANAATLIGATCAKQLPAFPRGTSWTKSEAQAALTAWPGQIWYAMCALRGFSRLKNTFFSSMVPGQVSAAKPPQKQTTPGEYATASKIAPKLQAMASSLGIPPAALALKAYWLASSLGGMNKILDTSDSRLVAYAKHYKSLAT